MSAAQADLKHELPARFFAAATHDASAAMCRWTDGLITLTFDEVRDLALEEVHPALELGDRPQTMIVLALEGEVGMRMILIFDHDDARALAASLLGKAPGQGPQLSPLERSALLETGNILGCAYMNTLARMIDCELAPSVPYYIEDYAASVLQSALLGPAMDADRALICQTGFHREGKNLDWRVVLIPTPAMREALENAIS